MVSELTVNVDPEHTKLGFQFIFYVTQVLDGRYTIMYSVKKPQKTRVKRQTKGKFKDTE